VDFAHTPDTAISRAGATRYAAILVDLRIRESDGIDLILRLRAQPYHGDTPIVVISGEPERGRADVRSPRLKILEWFDKPIDFPRMTKVLLSATSPMPHARRCILHVDDDPEVLVLVARELGGMAEVMSADCVEGALRILANHHVNLVVLDISLGEHSGLDLLQDLRDPTGNRIPVIIFSTHATGVPCDDQVNRALSKINSSLESLAAAVRDRLALLPAQTA